MSQVSQMNIDCLKNNSHIQKQVYSSKNIEKDGLILQVHHTVRINKREQRIRFIHTSFNDVGQLLAASDHAGNIFLVDFLNNKFWVLPNISSCSTLKFSIYRNHELIVGLKNGPLCIIDTNTGEFKGDLIGHHEPVTEITFSSDFQCLTASMNEAILWDLKSNAKVQVLSVQSHSRLKHVLFMPVTNNILACFDDDSVLIWRHHTFEVFKKIQPSLWNKNAIKSLAFTKNGRAMIFSGYSSQLTVYMLDTWTISNTILLPDCIQAVKKVDFIPQLFDGGSNRMLAILASNGLMYFYDMEQNAIINKIFADNEITRFECASNGKHLACVLKSGEINIYKVSQFIPTYHGLESKSSTKSTGEASSILKRNSSLVCVIQQQIKNVLDVQKLRPILKQYGQYPEVYRIRIWSQLLELPNNIKHYNAYINQYTRSSFESLLQEYPLENKLALKNLKKLLSNLVTWSPYFAQVSYLPVFVFPFVKVFQNEPILCFETICTIILNWCQYWFEYFPLPPLNVLAIIENVLQEHDVELLHHLAVNNVTSQLYGWSLLEPAFSEVLTSQDWCRTWDHILSNEPTFFLMLPVAYNILHRKALLAMKSLKEFEAFYHHQNIIEVKRLISKTYHLLRTTSEHNHPNRYLRLFQKLDPDSYPIFTGFPKTLIDFDFNEINNLKMEEHKIQKEHQEVLQDMKNEEDKVQLRIKQDEEEKRLKLLEQACKEKISEERDRVKEQRKRLVSLRRQLHQEEIQLLNKSRQQIIEKNSKDRQWAIEKILNDVEQSKEAEELEVIKAESEIIKHYSELLNHKMYLEEALNENQHKMPSSAREHRDLKMHQEKLVDELQKLQHESKSKAYVKQLNMTTGLAALDNLIFRIETELAKQLGEKYQAKNKSSNNMNVQRLKRETRDLESEVSRMLRVLADLKTQETEDKLGELQGKIIRKITPICPQESHYTRQEKLQDFKDKYLNMSGFEEDLGKLRKLIAENRDGYDARPSTPSTVASRELAVINFP